jgi:hypothetical protein
MLLALLVGCVDSPDTGDADTIAVTEEAQTDPAALALSELHVDWGGEEFTIIGREDHVFGELLVTEASTEVLDDAVYKRNLALEELCRLTMNCVGVPTDQLSSAVKADIKTGLGEYDAVHHHMAQTAALAADGQLLDFASLEGVDLSAPWWDEGTASFVISDKVYFMNSAINYSDERTTYVMMFNKQLAEGKAIDPYAMVYDNEWTLDTFGGLITDVSYDLSGDGHFDENDVYGFVVTWETGNTFFYGSDLRYVICADGKDPYMAMDESALNKASDLLDKVLNIYYTNNAAFGYIPGNEKLGKTCFQEGRALFYTEVVQYVVALGKQMEGDFGVLPIPKYDSAQKEYITWTNAICSTTSVTKAAKETERLGKTLEIMAILSYQRVTPAFYDTVLQRKSVRDEQSQGMLDIIFNNRCYDMSVYYDLGLESLFKTCVNENKTNYTSAYAKQSSKAQKALDKLIYNFAKDD